MWFLTVQMSMGYFLYDAVLVAFCFPNKAEKWQTLFHHSLAYLLHYVPVCVYKVFFAISAMGYLSEVSTPFLNTRWMLLQVQREGGRKGGGGSARQRDSANDRGRQAPAS
jgi:hypothetical protein